MTMKNLTKIMMVSGMVLSLSACETAGKIFGDEPERILPGERISVLSYQNETTPEPVLSVSQLHIPQMWQNKFWPQNGGYPNHAMGHLTLNGDLDKLWSSKVGKGSTKRRPLITVPVAADNMVFAMDLNARLTAFSMDKGKKLWNVKLIPEGEEKGSNVGGGIAYAQGHLFASTGYHNVVSLNPQNGEVLWETTVGTPVRAAPTVAHDKVFVVTLDNRLIALDAKTGQTAWDYTGYEETTNLLGAPSVAVDKNVVIAAFSSGEVVAFRAENGKTLWTENLSSLSQKNTLTAIADIRAMPVMDKGLVFVGNFGGKLVALDERSGRRVWQKNIGTAQTMWTAGNAVFLITTDQELIALSRDSGDIFWVRPLRKAQDEKEPSLWHGPILAGGRLLTVSNQGKVLEINPKTGELLAKWKTGQEHVSRPFVADQKLIMQSAAGKLMTYQ